MTPTIHNSCSLGNAIKSLLIRQSNSNDDFFEFRLAESIRDLQQEWDLLVTQGSFIESEICKLHEEASQPNIQYRYAIAYENGQPVLACCFQLVKIKPKNIFRKIDNEFLKLATSTFFALNDVRLIVVGNVFREECASRFICSLLPDLETHNIVNYLVENIRNREGASGVLWKEMPNDFLPPPKSISLQRDISMRLDIKKNWLTLEDYTKDLTKKYAARAKKIMLSASSIQIKELTLADIEENKGELQSLYHQVVDRQVFTFGALNQDYWAGLKKLYGTTFYIKALYFENKMVAFMSYFLDTEEVKVHYVGLDYAINQSLPLYFYLHFLGLQEAIVQKKQRLHMGRTSLEAKAILGCTPQFHCTYLQFHHSLLECAYIAASRSVAETEQWKTRSPFRIEEVKSSVHSD